MFSIFYDKYLSIPLRTKKQKVYLFQTEYINDPYAIL